MAAGGRERPAVQLGLQDFDHFVLLLELPAEPGGEGSRPRVSPRSPRSAGLP